RAKTVGFRGGHPPGPGVFHQPVVHYCNADGQFFTHTCPMVLNVGARRIPPALSLLLWCALGTALVQLLLWREASNPRGFSPIFWYLLSAYDAHGNLLLLAIAVAAFLL